MIEESENVFRASYFGFVRGVVKDGGYTEEVGSVSGLNSAWEGSGVDMAFGMDVDGDNINVGEVGIKV